MVGEVAGGLPRTDMFGTRSSEPESVLGVIRLPSIDSIDPGINGSQVLPGVDARVMSVGEVDSEGIVADKFCIEGLQCFTCSTRRGEYGKWVLLQFLPQLPRLGGGRVLTEVLDGVETAGLVVPLQRQAPGAVEVDVSRASGHGNSVAIEGRGSLRIMWG